METDQHSQAGKVIDEIFNTRKVKDASGIEYPLDSNVDVEEGKFLERHVTNNSCSATIEIGCAYGLSSLFICRGLEKTGGRHTIVDPFQQTDWKGIGINNLTRAGFNNFELISKPSEIALPELLSKNAKFDFAFIDGWHTFDHTLLDMFYMNRLLKVGGIMVIDDVGMKSVEMAVNYFLNYPAYKFLEGVRLQHTARRNRFNKFVINPLRTISRIIPGKIRKEIFAGQVIRPGIADYSMVALKKVAEDKRPWNWYEIF